LESEKQLSSSVRESEGSYTTMISQLKDRVNELEDALESEKDTSEILRSSKSLFESRSLELEADLSVLRDSFKAISVHESEYERDRNTFKARISSLEHQLADKSDIIASNEMKFFELTQSIDSLGSKLFTLQTKSEQDEALIVSLKMSKTDFQHSLDELKVKHTASQQESKLLSDKLKMATVRCSSLDAEIATLRNELTTEIQKFHQLEKEHQHEQTSLASSQEQLHHLKEENQTNLQQIKSFEEQIALLQSELKDSKEQQEKYFQLEIEQNLLKNKLSSCEEVIGKFENKKRKDLENLKKHNEKILAIQQEHEEEKLGLTHTIQTLKSQIHELELQQQKTDVGLIVATTQEQEILIKQQQDEITKLTEKVNQLSTQLSTSILCPPDSRGAGGDGVHSPSSLSNASRTSSSEGDTSFIVLESNLQMKRLLVEAEENLMKLEAVSNERIQLLESKLQATEKDKEMIAGELKAMTMTIQSKDEFISELQEERQRLESENNQLQLLGKTNSRPKSVVIKNMEKVAQTPPSSARQVVCSLSLSPLSHSLT
jgi:chromosome segregation ATPase